MAQYKPTYEIKIDPVFESLIPPLSTEEFEQLKENILEAGECHDPILVWNSIIVDGHNRWKIIQENPDITYQVREMIFLSRNDAMAWMIRNQLGRRNLPDYERARLALRLKETIAAEAKAKQESTLKQNSSVNQKSDERNELNTNKELAKVAGVSHDTIHKVDVIERKAPEEVKEQLRRGEVSINRAYKKIKEKEPPKPVVSVKPPQHTPARESFTINLSESDQKTIKKLSNDLRFSAKGNEGDTLKVFRFMLDYFKAIVDEATEYRQSAKGFIPDPSAGAIANYFRPIETTEALAEWIVFTSQQFAGNIWTSIAYEPKLNSKPEQKDKLTVALKQSMDFISETYQSLEQRQLNKEKGNQ